MRFARRAGALNGRFIKAFVDRDFDVKVREGAERKIFGASP